MERRLYFIRAELLHESIDIPNEADENPRAPYPREIIDLEAQIERDETEIKELAENSTELQKNHAELLEYKYSLQNSGESYRTETILNETGEPSEGPLDFVVGLIPREKFMSFERMLYRISRGNIFIRSQDVDHIFKDTRTVSKGFLFRYTAYPKFFSVSDKFSLDV